jgi:hypothetical protein
VIFFLFFHQPVPAHKSRTQSPLFEKRLIKKERSLSGFWQGFLQLLDLLSFLTISDPLGIENLTQVFLESLESKLKWAMFLDLLEFK